MTDSNGLLYTVGHLKRRGIMGVVNVQRYKPVNVKRWIPRTGACLNHGHISSHCINLDYFEPTSVNQYLPMLLKMDFGVSNALVRC